MSFAASVHSGAMYRRRGGASAERDPLLTPIWGVNAGETRKWKLILPHVGLVLLLTLYIFVGAAIFYMLESPRERHERKSGVERLRDEKRRLLDDVWQLRRASGTFEEFKGATIDRMDDYLEIVFGAFDNSYVSNAIASGDDETISVWTFPNAVLFTVTTLSTVGYGSPAPRTSAGRIFCVFFGLIGIPLTLVTVADMAKFLGAAIVALYRRVSGALKQVLLRRSSRAQSTSVLDVPMGWVFFLLLLYPVLGAVALGFWEGWSFFDSFYFCFISVFTIGFGDFIPANEQFFALTTFFILLGLVMTTMCVDLVASQYIDEIHYFGRKIGAARAKAKKALNAVATGALGAWKTVGLMRMPLGMFSGMAHFDASLPAAAVPRGAYDGPAGDRLQFVDAASSVAKPSVAGRASAEALSTTHSDESEPTATDRLLPHH